MNNALSPRVQIQRLPVQESTHIPDHYNAVLRQSGCDLINSNSSDLIDDEPQLTELNLPSHAFPPPYIIPVLNGAQDLNNPLEITPIQPAHPSVQQISDPIPLISYEGEPILPSENIDDTNETGEKHYTTLERPSSPANYTEPSSLPHFQNGDQIVSFIETNDVSTIDENNTPLFDINSEGDRNALKNALENMGEDFTAAYWLSVENVKASTTEQYLPNNLFTLPNLNIPIQKPVESDKSQLDPVPGLFVSPKDIHRNERSIYERNDLEPAERSFLLDKSGYNSGRHSDILKAAQSLYSKRTRTLWHWINPGIPKTKLKTCVQTAWDSLPDWQKKIYVSQVMGKFGIGSVSPMINPQIASIHDKDKSGPSMEDELKKEMSLELSRAMKKPEKPRVAGRKPTRRNHALDEFMAAGDILEFDEALFSNLQDEDGSDPDYTLKRRKKKSRNKNGISKKIKKETSSDISIEEWSSCPDIDDELFSDVRLS